MEGGDCSCVTDIAEIQGASEDNCVTACPAVKWHHTTTLDTQRQCNMAVISQVMSKALIHFSEEEETHPHHPMRAPNHT